MSYEHISENNWIISTKKEMEKKKVYLKLTQVQLVKAINRDIWNTQIQNYNYNNEGLIMRPIWTPMREEYNSNSF